MRELPLEFAALYNMAKSLTMSECAADQIIAVQTSKSNIYHFANRRIASGDTKDEEAFGEMLVQKGDTEIQYIVCMWQDHSIDVPSWNLRRLLTSIDPVNSEAKILLNGGNTFAVRAIKTWISPTVQK